jgi:TPP-dependent pyruvate/acetoin dehydrogenase alpha subunit
MFDPKCYELAEYFLAENGAVTEEHKAELAQAIQDAVEDFDAPAEEYPDPRAYPLADNH